MSNLSEEKYDFIVGFTLFTPKGFRTMYRHFDNLEIAEMFASNVNIKDNHKIYVDLDLYNKEKEKNKELERIKHLDIYKLVEDYETGQFISKDKIRERIEEIRKIFPNDVMFTREFLITELKGLLEE